MAFLWRIMEVMISARKLVKLSIGLGLLLIPSLVLAHGLHVDSPFQRVLGIRCCWAAIAFVTAAVPREVLETPNGISNTSTSETFTSFSSESLGVGPIGLRPIDSQGNFQGNLFFSLNNLTQLMAQLMGPGTWEALESGAPFPSARARWACGVDSADNPNHPGLQTREGVINFAQQHLQTREECGGPGFMTFHITNLPPDATPLPSPSPSPTPPPGDGSLQIELVNWVIRDANVPGNIIDQGNTNQFAILPAESRCVGDVNSATAPIMEDASAAGSAAYTTIRWRVHRGGQPAASVPVEISLAGPAAHTLEAAGHDHQAGRPLGQLNGSANLPLVRNSGPDGIVSVEYRPPSPAGSIGIRAQLDADTSSSLQAKVHISHLRPLIFGSGLAPAGSDGSHAERFNGRALTLERLETAANLYVFDQTTSPALRKVETPEPIRVNDMSLPWGGLFDIGGNWQPPHSGHRCGTVSDIQSRHLVAADGHTPVDSQGDACTEETDDRACGIHKKQWRLLGEAILEAGGLPCFHANHLHTFWDRPGGSCFTGSFNPFPQSKP